MSINGRRCLKANEAGSTGRGTRPSTVCGACTLSNRMFSQTRATFQADVISLHKAGLATELKTSHSPVQRLARSLVDSTPIARRRASEPAESLQVTAWESMAHGPVPKGKTNSHLNAQAAMAGKRHMLIAVCQTLPNQPA